MRVTKSQAVRPYSTELAGEVLCSPEMPKFEQGAIGSVRRVPTAGVGRTERGRCAYDAGVTTD